MVLSTLVNCAPQLQLALMMAGPMPEVVSVSVPPPDKLTGPWILRNVLFWPALTVMCPEFEILPAAAREVLSLMMRLSPLSIVRVPTLTLMSSVTCELAPLPSSMQTFVLALLGTAPVLHFVESLQLPAPPSQLVVVPAQFVGGSPGKFGLFSPPRIIPFNPAIFAVNAPPIVAPETLVPVEPGEVAAVPAEDLENCAALANGKSRDVVAPARYTASCESTAMPRAWSVALPPK